MDSESNLSIKNKDGLNVDAIQKILKKIRTKGAGDPKPAKELLQLLSGNSGRTNQECKNFCRSMFIHYIKDKDDLKLILYVSGFINDTYEYMDTATARRKAFLDELETTDIENKHYMADADTLRRSVEPKILKSIAKKIYTDFESGLLSKFIKEWVSEKTDVESLFSAAPQDVNISNDVVERNININLEEAAVLNINVYNRGGFCEVSEREQTTQIQHHFPLTSNVPVDEIFLSSDKPVLKQGVFYQIRATVLPKEAINAPLNYVSMDTDVATISATGMVLAQGKWQGQESRTTNIIVQAESGATAKKLITVYTTDDYNEQPTADVEDFIAPFTIHLTVRPADKSKNWTDLLEVNVGDEVEYRIEYKNTSNEDQSDVMIRDSLPNNMEYVPGSTRLWNSKYTGVTLDQDDIVTSGLKIGTYAPNSNAIIRFNAKVVDKDLKCGSNTLVNWGQGTVGNVYLQDYANVHLDKE